MGCIGNQLQTVRFGVEKAINQLDGDSYGLDHGAHIGGAEDGQNFCAF